MYSMQPNESFKTIFPNSNSKQETGKYLINNLLEMDRDACTIQILVVSRIVNKFGNFVQPHLWISTPLSSTNERHSPLSYQKYHHNSSLRKKKSKHLTCLARFPKTNNIASITLLFPLPFGPTTAEKLCPFQKPQYQNRNKPNL